MITKKQWREFCYEIRKKRFSEGKDIYFGFHEHDLHICFNGKPGIIITYLEKRKTILTHNNFIGKSYKEVKSQFYCVEKKNFNEIEKSLVNI